MAKMAKKTGPGRDLVFWPKQAKNSCFLRVWRVPQKVISIVFAIPTRRSSGLNFPQKRQKSMILT